MCACVRACLHACVRVRACVSWCTRVCIGVYACVCLCVRARACLHANACVEAMCLEKQKGPCFHDADFVSSVSAFQDFLLSEKRQIKRP